MDIIVDRVSSSSTMKKEEEEESVVTKEEEEEIDDYADWTKGNWCYLLPATNTNKGTITTTTHSTAVQLEKGRKKNDKATIHPPVVSKCRKRAAPERRRRDYSHGRQKRYKDMSSEKDLLRDNNNNNDDDDDDDENEIDELPKKEKKRKLKCCRSQQQYNNNSSSIHPNNLPSSSNNSIKDNEIKVDDTKNEIKKNAHVDTIIKQEEGVKTKEEEEEEEEEEDDNSDSKIHAADNNDNDNDTDADADADTDANTDANTDSDADADADGYESWTVGNWCLLLPSTTNTSLTDDEKKDDEPLSEELSVIESTSTQKRVRNNSRRRRRRRESSSVSSSGVGNDDTDENEYYDEDSVDNDDDDTIHKKTGKGTIKHRNIAYNKQWHGMFRRLVAYQNKYGSANVSRSYKDGPKLAIWVHNQRMSYRNKTLSEERIRRLVSIGFVWIHHEVIPWDDMYQRLVTYKREYNSASVPHHYKEDPKLGRWVHHQRTHYKAKSISIYRINRLESTGFVWDPYDSQWMGMYEKLVAYKKQYRSTKVPQHYMEDPQLGKWINKQRVRYKKSELTDKRMELLNSINFVWSMKKASIS
jgi:hypothetical protein